MFWPLAKLTRLGNEKRASFLFHVDSVSKDPVIRNMCVKKAQIPTFIFSHMPPVFDNVGQIVLRLPHPERS